jgi:hypothetical protein
MIFFHCSRCNTRLKANAYMATWLFPCPQCMNPVTVPGTKRPKKPPPVVTIPAYEDQAQDNSYEEELPDQTRILPYSLSSMILSVIFTALAGCLLGIIWKIALGRL